MDILKAIVKQNVLKEISEQIRLALCEYENAGVELAAFPEFPISVEDYIYTSLNWALRNNGKETMEGIMTILTNAKQLQLLEDSQAYRVFKGLTKSAEEMDKSMAAKYFEVNPDKKREPTCKKSCAFCCLQAVQLNGLEAKFLWKKVPKTGYYKDQQKAFRELRDTASTEQSLYVAKLGIKAARCPFLNDANECTTYEERPLVCRYYVSYDKVEKCDPTKTQPNVITSLPVFMIILETVMFEAYGCAVLQDPNNLMFLKPRGTK